MIRFITNNRMLELNNNDARTKEHKHSIEYFLTFCHPHNVLEVKATGAEMQAIIDTFSNIPAPKQNDMYEFTWYGDFAKIITANILNQLKFKQTCVIKYPEES